MRSIKWMGLAVVLSMGCGQAPPPTGPAAEATTPEVEVTIPDESTPADAAPTSALPNADQTTLVSFKVPGMSCPFGCVATVKETLEKVPGVVQVDVDFDSKTAKCKVDASKFDDQLALGKLTAQDQFKETTLVQQN